MKHGTSFLIYLKLYLDIKIKLKYTVLIFVERGKPEDIEKTLEARLHKH